MLPEVGLVDTYLHNLWLVGNGNYRKTLPKFSSQDENVPTIGTGGLVLQDSMDMVNGFKLEAIQHGSLINEQQSIPSHRFGKAALSCDVQSGLLNLL